MQESKQDPVVQSIVSLTSLLVVKILTILVSTISNSQVFLLKKNVSSFCNCKSYSHFFSKTISIYAIFNDQSFNNTLTNGIVSFEQLGPKSHKSCLAKIVDMVSPLNYSPYLLLVECPLWDREVVGSIPGWAIPMTKNGTTCNCFLAWWSGKARNQNCSA